ncbi:hypothetical protein BLNAU_15540 [Blattamonas nauphoetae]|uniref:non-specific serine/threonine protein kinase n=1 Tax=Blattamonas nauphoetae TaxID=2049346 RepID=A0ABQ9XAQ6_9EUKA|nr:hypothetical protein BLNAU_15540 [Blattamonas nauphoetae]
MMDYANLPALNRLIDGRFPPLPENVVGIFISQILLCIAEFYEHRLIHRTPVYLAPEIVYLSPRYSHKSDTWAIGVMLFILLCRSYPFEGASTHQLYTSIQTKPHTITRRDLSQHCTDAINALLSKSPAQRPTAREALELPFFKQFEEDAQSGVTWTTFAQVTSGHFPKPPPQIYYIPDTHRTEQNYRHVSPLRRAQNRPSSHSQPASTSPYPASSPHDPTRPPSAFSADPARPPHPLPKNMPKHIQNGARFPARQSTGPAQVCEVCGKAVPMDQMKQHKENEHKLSVSAPAAVPLPQLVPKFMGPAPPEAARLHFVGLVNPGLQCYLNIVVQSLFHIPLFRNILTSLPLPPSPSPRHPLHVGLHRLFQAMLTSQTPVNTSVLTQTIHFPQFDVRQMNDTQDFFNRLVNGLHTELKNTPLRGLASSLLSGRLIRRTPLEQRGRMSVSVHPEHFWSLRVPIELGNGVEDVLPKLLIPDQRGNTQKIYSLPPVLFVDLVRWTSGPGGLMKNNKRFAFPTSLDLSRMIEPLTLTEKMNAIQKKKEIKKAKGQAPSAQAPQSPQLQQSLTFNEPRHAAQRLVYSSELSGLGESEKEQAWMAKQKTGPFYSQSFRYSLLAVEVHSGSLTVGHYYSFIRPLGTREWFECNDETIRRVEEREAIEGQFGGVVNGREVAHSAMSLVYVQDCHADRIAMKEPTRVHPHPVPKPDPHPILKPDPMQNQSELISLRQQCDHLQSQLRQAEIANTNGQQTIDDLTRKVNALQNRNNSIEDEKNNLDKAVKALKDQLKNAEQAQKQVDTQIQRSEQEMRTATANIEKERDEMRRQIAVLRRDLEQRAKELKDTKQEMNKQEISHQQTIELLSRSEANNQKMKDEMTQKTNDFQSRYKAIEEERNNLNQTVKALKDQLQTANQVQPQVQKLEREKVDMKQEMASRETNHKNAIERLTNERNQFEGRLKNLEKDHDKLVTELKTEKEKTKTLSQTVDQMEKDNTSREKLKEEMDQLRQRLAVQKRQTEAIQQTAAQSEKELQTEKAKTKALQSEVDRQNKYIDELRQKATKAEEGRLKTDEKLKQEERERERLQRETDYYKTQQREGQDTLKATQDRFARLEQNNLTLGSEIRTLQNKLQKSEDARKAEEEMYRKKDDEFKANRRRLENENEDMNSQIETLRREVEHRAKELKDTKQEMARQENNHKNALDNLTHERNQFESQLKNLEKDTDTIMKELKAEKEKDMDRLRQELEDQKRQTTTAQLTTAQSQEEQRKMVEKLKKEERERERLQQEFEDYKTKYQLEKGTLNTTQERFARLQQDNQKLGSEIRTLQNDLLKSEDARKSEAEMNRKKDEELRRNRTELNNVKAQFEQTIDDLTRKATDLQNRNNTFEDERNRLNQTIKALNDQLQTTNQVQLQVKKLEGEKEDLKNQITNEINRYERSIQTLTDKIQRTESQLIQEKEDHRRQRQKLESEKADTLSELEVGRELAARLRSERDHANETMKNYQTRTENILNRLRQELEDQKSQTSAAHRTAAQSAEELQMEKEKTEQLQSEVDRRNKDIDELQQKTTKAEEIQREFENYKTKHQLEKGTLNATQERFAQLQQDNQKLGSDIRTLQNDLQKSEDARKSEEEMNRKKDEELRRNQKELNTVKAQLQQTNGRAQYLEAKWREAELRGKAFEDMNKEMVGQTTNHNSAINKLTNERNQLESQLKNLEKDMKQLRHELEEQKRQSEAIRQTAAQSAKELQTEKEKTGQLQSEVDRRIKDIDELQQKTTKAEEIQREFENYKTKHQLEKGTLSATQDSFARLQQDNQKLGSEIRTLQNDLLKSEDARKSEAEMNRKKDEELRRNRTELNNVKAQFEQTIDDLTRKATDLQNRNNTFEDERNRLNQTIKALNDQLQTTNQVQLQVKKLEGEKEDVNSQITTLRREVEHRAKELKDTKQEMARQENDHKNAFEKLVYERNQLLEKSDGFQNQLEHLEKEKDKVVNELKMEQKENARLHSELEKTSEKLKQEEQQQEETDTLNEAQERITQLEQIIQALRNEQQEHNKELAALRMTVQEKEEHIKRIKLSEASRHLQTALDAERKKSKSLEIDLKMATEANTRSKASWLEERENNKKMQEQHEREIQEQKQRHDGELENLRAESLRKKVIALPSTEFVTQDQLRRSLIIEDQRNTSQARPENEKIQLLIENKTLQRQLHKSEEARKASEERARDFEAKWRRQENEGENMKRQIRSLLGEADQRRKEHENLQSRCTHLQSQLYHYQRPQTNQTRHSPSRSPSPQKTPANPQRPSTDQSYIATHLQSQLYHYQRPQTNQTRHSPSRSPSPQKTPANPQRPSTDQSYIATHLQSQLYHYQRPQTNQTRHSPSRSPSPQKTPANPQKPSTDQSYIATHLQSQLYHYQRPQTNQTRHSPSRSPSPQKTPANPQKPSTNQSYNATQSPYPNNPSAPPLPIASPTRSTSPQKRGLTIRLEHYCPDNARQKNLQTNHQREYEVSYHLKRPDRCPFDVAFQFERRGKTDSIKITARAIIFNGKSTPTSDRLKRVMTPFSKITLTVRRDEIVFKIDKESHTIKERVSFPHTLSMSSSSPCDFELRSNKPLQRGNF